MSGFPETLRALERQEIVIVDAEDPDADPAEVALLRARRQPDRWSCSRSSPRAQSIGLVELFSRGEFVADAERLELARTMANEAAMALENARLYEDARKLADRDPLTGFYNHRFLHERLGEEVVRAQRGRRPLSVLMLDLDDFKLVNDTFGHLFGDRVLTWAAELIRSSLRVLRPRRALRRRRVRGHPARRPTRPRPRSSPSASSRPSATARSSASSAGRCRSRRRSAGQLTRPTGARRPSSSPRPTAPSTRSSACAAPTADRPRRRADGQVA